MLTDKIEVKHSCVGIIEDINNRKIGDTCFREIELFLGHLNKSFASPSRRIKIRTLRFTKENITKTFFCAVAPTSFKNISFLLTEQKGCYFPFSIKLYIPYGSKLVRVLEEGRRFDEIFGSDFTYNDLKTWLYIQDQNYSLSINQNHNSDEIVVVNNLSKTSVSDQKGYAKEELFIDSSRVLVNKHNLYKHSGLFKELKFKNYVLSNDILIQQEMIMTNFDVLHETTIILESCWHNYPVEEDLFYSEDFSKLCQYIHSINA